MKIEFKKIVATVAAAVTLTVGGLSLAGCNYCAHDLETIEKEASTCMEHGHGYSYRCKKCDKLFAYTVEKGLYEISEAEELPLGAHALTDELSVRLKDGKTQAESIWDYEVAYKCGLCGEEAPMPGEHLATIVPPNIEGQGSKGWAYKGEYGYNENNVPYTSVEFAATTVPADEIELNPCKFAKPTTGKTDPTVKYDEKYEWVYASHIGGYQRFPLYIPFNADETRYAYFFIKNTTTSTTDPLNISWSIDGKKNWANVTIAPGEVKPLLVTGLLDYNNNLVSTYIKVNNPNNATRLGKKMTVEITGQYYVAGTVTKLDVDELPTKTEYSEGEVFDPSGLKIYATYSDYILGKTLRIEECEFSCGDKPLTKADDKITVSYGGMRVSFNITVA